MKQLSRLALTIYGYELPLSQKIEKSSESTYHLNETCL